MKIEQAQETFRPVTITLETLEEYEHMKKMVTVLRILEPWEFTNANSRFVNSLWQKLMETRK